MFNVHWWVFWLVLLCGGWPLHGSAVEVDVLMRYRGDPAGRFENMTPRATFCAIWPHRCTDDPYFAVLDLPITYQKYNVGNDSDFRNRHYVQMPAGRTVEVVNETGRSYRIDFSFTDIHQELIFLSNSMWAQGEGGCDHIESVRYNSKILFLWKLKQPMAPEACYDNIWNIRQTAEVAVKSFGVRFRLNMPRPVGMQQGIYRGSLDYTIGPGGDFDFGNAVTDLNDTRLTINFELDVQHDLYLEFPAGSDRAVLDPPGGWMAWLGGRGTPGKLYRDLPLRISTTGPMRVYKRCEYELGDQCGIRESAGHLVGVDVSLTLPRGLQQSGRPIERLLIPTRQPAALLIEPVTTVWRQTGQLHFEIAGSSVPPMLAHPGSHYQGLVTVVFEADI